eukprot:1925699-Pleurochrysis_carterae.AAC.2
MNNNKDNQSACFFAMLIMNGKCRTESRVAIDRVPKGSATKRQDPLKSARHVNLFFANSGISPSITGWVEPKSAFNRVCVKSQLDFDGAAQAQMQSVTSTGTVLYCVLLCSIACARARRARGAAGMVTEALRR